MNPRQFATTIAFRRLSSAPTACAVGRIWFRWFLPDAVPPRPAARVVRLAEIGR